MPNYLDDEPRIKHGIRKRLEGEKGVKLMQTQVVDKGDHIAVGIMWIVDDLVVGTSIFDLKPVFELVDVHNQCDEIAEQIKEARRAFLINGGKMAAVGAVSETYAAKGTGRRGSWRSHAHNG